MPRIRKSRSMTEIGQHFGKRDIDRIGFFSETGWLHGVPHSSAQNYQFRPGASQGNQMLSGGPKMKAGLQDCYFEKGYFKRIFEKEAYFSSVREGYLASMAASKRNVSSLAFLAGAPSKKHSTPGDFYGTFGGRIPAMSRVQRPRPPHKLEPPNVKTSPGKKGTYGFVDITFDKFPVYMPHGHPSRFGSAAANRRAMLDGPLVSMRYPQACFDPNPWRVDKPASTYVKRTSSRHRLEGPIWVPPSLPKQQGNNHDGCFSKFPSHMPDKYIDMFRILRGPPEAKVFTPQFGGKSKYTLSVANHNVDFRVNARNWRAFQPVTYKYNAVTGETK